MPSKYGKRNMVVFSSGQSGKTETYCIFNNADKPELTDQHLDSCLFGISSLPHEDTPRPAFFRAANRFYRTFIAK